MKKFDFQKQEINDHKYPVGSFAVYALKSIEPGTLIIVEQPFASIDNRVNSQNRFHSINFLKSQDKTSNIEFVQDETLRLINEIEKQLLIGHETWITFDKLRLMQPIRRWIEDKSDEIDFEPIERIQPFENESIIPLFYRQWRKSVIP